MTRLLTAVFALFCQALQPAEREAVLGDLQESAASPPQALWEVSLLVLRRQLLAWADWRPWLATVGLIGVAAFPLSESLFRLIVGIALQLRTYQRYGVRYESGVTFGQDLSYITCSLLALLAWLWMSGFVLGSLSGPVTWLTGTAFWFAVSDVYWLRLLLSGNITLRAEQGPMLMLLTRPILSPAILLLPVAIWGMWQGVTHRFLKLTNALALTLLTGIFIALLLWMARWYQDAMEVMAGHALERPFWFVTLQPLLLMSSPALYLVAVSLSSRKDQLRRVVL